MDSNDLSLNLTESSKIETPYQKFEAFEQRFYLQKKNFYEASERQIGHFRAPDNAPPDKSKIPNLPRSFDPRPSMITRREVDASPSGYPSELEPPSSANPLEWQASSCNRRSRAARCSET